MGNMQNYKLPVKKLVKGKGILIEELNYSI
jgi:hypothetical protein